MNGHRQRDASGLTGRRRSGRRGISLFEVLLSVAIFMGALAVIAQIVSVGSRAAIRGELESEAALRAQTKLGEVLSGIEPMESVTDQVFADDSRWRWSLTIGDGPHSDLFQLTLAVTHQTTGGTVDGAVMLTRLIRNPQLFIDAAALESTESAP
jgi:general secretion pathway protein I